jgi:hypothetical protein
MSIAKSVTATFTSTLKKHLLVAYNFNEGTGVFLTDASGHGLTGTTSGTTWTTGKYGNALSFPSSTARVITGLQSLAPVRTYMLWSKRTGGGGNSLGRLLEKRYTGAEVEILYNDEVAHVYRYRRVWSGGIASWSIPQPTANAWHHLAVVYDASSPANRPQIYVDGVAQVVTQVSAPSGTSLTNTDSYLLGNRGAGDRGWQGQLDDLRIYDRALTTSEIQSAMNTPVAP